MPITLYSLSIGLVLKTITLYSLSIGLVFKTKCVLICFNSQEMCTSCQNTNVYWCISIPTNALGRSISRNVHIFLSKCVLMCFNSNKCVFLSKCVLMRFNSNKCTWPICHEILIVVKKKKKGFIGSSYISSLASLKLWVRVVASPTIVRMVSHQVKFEFKWWWQRPHLLISHHLASLKL